MPEEYSMEHVARFLNVDPFEIQALCQADPSVGQVVDGRRLFTSADLEKITQHMGRTEAEDSSSPTPGR